MSNNAVLAYRKAWKALNTMLEEGKSYSGFEANSAFLNLGIAADGTPRFADVSGACGLDHLDDGRAIGVVDWDFDGKQDFWITNRTAPRLRFQQNRSTTGNQFVALKLRGETNRLAIGARVTLTLQGSGARRIRTVRAGEGFLAQSSTWVHFGLAAGEAVGKVEVRWPGGATETIGGIQSGRFHTVDQGSGRANPWQPPSDHALTEVATPVNATTSQQARIVMASRLPFPNSRFTALDGSAQPIASDGKPLLINLWATWCAPCLVEMKDWAAEAKALQSAGLGVLALSVDEVGAEAEARLKTVSPFLARLSFPFTAGLATTDFLETLEVAGRAQIDKFESFPVPSSILLDPQRRMAVIYKGPVTVEQLKRDVALLGATAATLHAEAAHFPGYWIEGPWPATPTVMIDKFMSFGKPAAAKAYLDAFTVSADERANHGLAESYFLVASELRNQGNDREALAAYARTLQLNPRKTRARLEAGTLLFKIQRFAEALPHLAAVVEAQPDVDNTRKMLAMALLQTRQYPDAVEQLSHLARKNPTDALGRMWFGHALVRAGRAAEAEAHLRESLRLQPNSYLAANELAWLLATHPSDHIRKPDEALRLAQSAATATSHKQPRILDTLAAAQAAKGDFAAALTTIDGALKLAEHARDQGTLADLQSRRTSYQRRIPWRETNSGISKP
ncbi:MAG: ASPIC/UnbV domain-containing protein [Verrucomicrobiales bacterium]